MMDNDVEITIRQERLGDLHSILALVERSFADMEESDHSEHRLVQRLHVAEGYILELSLVAVTPGRKIVGYVLLTRISVDDDVISTPTLALAPLAVLPEFQNQGIGEMLMRKAHEVAASHGHKSIILLGHKDYYPRFGYKKSSDFGIKFPFDAPDECCMVVELVPDALRCISGTVNYPKVFFAE